jgi:hypothetical protein
MEAMSGKSGTERDALDRLVDALVDDILNTSDEDILAEFRDAGGDPERFATSMRASFENILIAANKKRLDAAKAGLASSARSPTGTSGVIDIAAARANLHRVLNEPGMPVKLTLAARNESEMSDSDVISMIEDLRELGVLVSDDESSRG